MVKFFFFRFLVPILWTLGTVFAVWFQYETIFDLYRSYPTLTVDFILMWIILGAAFLPLARAKYTWGSVSLITAGTFYSLFINDFNWSDQINLALVIGVWLGVCIAWLGGFGTLYWRFGQGKLAVDDDDT